MDRSGTTAKSGPAAVAEAGGWRLRNPPRAGSQTAVLQEVAAAVPCPSAITLYVPGQGLPADFDQEKADEYFRRVTAFIRDLIRGTLHKWQVAGF